MPVKNSKSWMLKDYGCHLLRLISMKRVKHGRGFGEWWHTAIQSSTNWQVSRRSAANLHGKVSRQPSSC